MTELRGALRWQELTQGSGAGGDTFLNIRPPEGEVWDLYAVAASHNDAARTISWMLNDTDTGSFGALYSEAAVTAAHYLARDIGLALPLRITYTCYLMYKIAGMAGAKTITGEVAYERIVGVPTWTGK